MQMMAWIFSAFIIFSSLLMYLVRKLTPPHEKSSYRLPPGPRRLPIIGNLHQLSSKLPPHRRLVELAKVYGPIMYLRLGEIPTVVVSSPDVAAEVMKTHDASFASRPKLLAGELLFYDQTDVALAPYGEYWRQLRKIATLELFTAKRLQSFQAIREEEVTNMVKLIASEAALGPINLTVKIFNLLFSITSRVAFSHQGGDEDAFRQFCIDLSRIMAISSLADVFPSIKLLHSIGGMKRQAEKMVQVTDMLLDPIIEEHKSKKHDRTVEDFVDILLKFHKEDSDGSEFHLTMNNIKAVILEMYIGGSETSHVLIEWAMSELLRNPKVMEKAQAEVREVYRTEGVFNEASLDKLKFLKLVVKEALRLYSPAPLLIPRESIKHCQISGYDVPAKTRVVINAWGIARDPNYWSDPNTFRPERFENSSIDYKGTNFEYLPFGAGRRMCPGMSMGTLMVELSLAMLLCHFDWKLPNGMKPEDLDMEEIFGLGLQRKIDLQAIATPYTCS